MVKFRLLAAFCLFVVLCFVMPLVAMSLFGQIPQDFFVVPRSPPAYAYMRFSWPLAVVYWACVIGLVYFWWSKYIRNFSLPIQVPAASRDRQLQHQWPRWGYVALVFWLFFWIVAWNRFSWCANLQEFTYIPLWFSFIFCLNACLQYRTGKCPLINESLFYGALFFVSAFIWWGFEYFNLFVHSWWYPRASPDFISFFISSTLSFASVLPALYAMQKLLASFQRLQQRSIFL